MLLLTKNLQLRFVFCFLFCQEQQCNLAILASLYFPNGVYSFALIENMLQLRCFAWIHILSKKVSQLGLFCIMCFSRKNLLQKTCFRKAEMRVSQSTLFLIPHRYNYYINKSDKIIYFTLLQDLFVRTTLVLMVAFVIQIRLLDLV